MFMGCLVAIDSFYYKYRNCNWNIANLLARSFVCMSHWVCYKYNFTVYNVTKPYQTP